MKKGSGIWVIEREEVGDHPIEYLHLRDRSISSSPKEGAGS